MTSRRRDGSYWTETPEDEQRSHKWMRLYSVQAVEVVERLASGLVHVQPWEKSAASTGTPSDPDGHLHRAAYEFLAREFKNRTERVLDGAPIFTFLDREKALSTLDVSGPSKLLTLEVPASEMLLTDYHFWAWTVLFRWCGLHDFLGCTTSCREDSWRASLFKVPAETSNQQGILNRIEPQWVKATYPSP